MPTPLPWGNEFLVNSTTLNGQYQPTITALSDGRFVVAWTDTSQTGGDTSGSAMRARVFNADGTPALSTAEEIFKAEGKLAFMAQLALAAYHLGSWEKPLPEVNDINPTAELAFNGSPMGPIQNGNNRYTALDVYLDMLTPADLPGLDLSPSLDTRFPQNGLKDGIYTNENAAALVARSADALFIAFRGTNDNEESTGPWYAGDTPDKAHWWGLGDEGLGAHWALFEQHIDTIRDYINTAANGITKIYVTGHSLGAAMVEALSNIFGSDVLEFVTFASPGYGVGFFDDSRITNFWIDRDPILSASPFGDNAGDTNTVFHNLRVGRNITDPATLHSMVLYSDFMRFFAANGFDQFDQADFRSLQGIDYDLIHAHVSVINEAADLFTIGTGANNIEGKFLITNNGVRNSFFNDLILGGAGDDTLKGLEGRDYLVGGDDWDKLFGGAHRDFLVGGYGYDELSGGTFSDRFIFNNVKETNSQGVGSQADLITDFNSRFLRKDIIDLSEIDANWNLTDNQPFDFIKGAAFGGIAGQLRFQQRNGETIILGDTDGDGVENFFIRLTGLHTMSDGLFAL